MNETDEYSNVQRRLCAVIAKSEWTSSRMRMQKSGEELRERRAKSHRTANQFLQELLEKRTDSDLIDDHGAVDRYHHFVKSKSTLHNDTNTTLDEFHRRLRDLNNNNHHQKSPIKKLPDVNFSSKQSHDRRSTTSEIRHDEDDDDERSKRSRIFPSISILPATSTPNDTTHELTTSSFHVDEIQNLSYVQSPNTSFIHSSTNPVESSLNEHHQSSLLDKFEALNSSTLSSTHSQTPTLHVPKARRADGTELGLLSPSSSSRSSLSFSKSPVLTNISLFNHSYLPRSLTTRGKFNVNSTFKRQLPTVPSSDQKPVLQEHISSDQLYDLLDNLDTPSSQDTFTHKLEQITVSTKVSTNEESHANHSSVENPPVMNNDKENILPNLFNHCQTSSREEQFYSTFQINIEDVKDLILYTMTLSTVQLSASILLPYSILNGRRPLLTCSNQTCFKKISSKQPKNTYQVTAIEKSLNATEFQPNDIILKVNDQSVWGMTTDEISELLRTSTQRSNPCSLTFARLCQPFI
ncbi:unnamed protein product [Adineta ricciae]|uniref:PDZ domain-containing protein n=1 Tax=Adineta ricciae TaxID=249248 RepID=A0A814HIT0_ADIRI|nr:unnamed protein product [Adineta ricciae]CAF1011416.1 unnamed protein product [Adineta ricciae]